MAKEYEDFNCSEDHENKYVSDLYEEENKVSKFLKNGCEDGSINDTTHEKLYTMLYKEGFTKKA
jgi:hypothetical protein